MRSFAAFLRAWRISGRIIALNFRAQLEYRGEFLLGIGIGAVWQVSIIVFATVLLGRFAGMGGWPVDAVLLVVAMRMVSHGLNVLFFGRVHDLSFLVEMGVIDGFLLRPVPVYRQVQLSHFPTNAIGDLLVAVSLFTAALWRVELEWSWVKVAFLVAGVLGGMLTEAAIITTISCAAFRYPATSYWSTWVEELMGTFGSYPLKILPSAVSGLLTFVLPLAFIAYLPAAVLTRNVSGIGVPEVVATAAPLVGLALFVGSRVLWNWSLRHYTGVNG